MIMSLFATILDSHAMHYAQNIHPLMLSLIFWSWFIHNIIFNQRIIFFRKGPFCLLLCTNNIVCILDLMIKYWLMLKDSFHENFNLAPFRILNLWWGIVYNYYMCGNLDTWSESQTLRSCKYVDNWNAGCLGVRMVFLLPHFSANST